MTTMTLNCDELHEMSQLSSQSDLSGRNDSTKATCQEMCSLSEFLDRKQSHIYSVFETDKQTNEFVHHLAVKEYCRSAAGETISDPEQMRTKDSILMSMRHIINAVSNDSRASWTEWYDFLWSRTRAVRKELNQLCIDDEISYRILQAIIKFHLVVRTLFQSRPKGIGIDMKLNDENLTACFADLFYSEIFNNSEKFNKLSFDYLSYFTLYNLDQPLDLNLRLAQLYKYKSNGKYFEEKINLYQDFLWSIKCSDSAKVCQLFETKFNILERCVLSPFVAHFRFLMLDKIIASFRSKKPEIKLGSLAKLLGLDLATLDERLTRFNYYSKHCSDHTGQILLAPEILEILSINFFLSVSSVLDRNKFCLSDIISFDSDGFFDIDQSNIDPKVYIYENCDDFASATDENRDYNARNVSGLIQEKHEVRNQQITWPPIAEKEVSKHDILLSDSKFEKKAEISSRESQYIEFDEFDISEVCDLFIQQMRAQFLKYKFNKIKQKYVNSKIVSSRLLNHDISTNPQCEETNCDKYSELRKSFLINQVKLFKLRICLDIWYQKLKIDLEHQKRIQYYHFSNQTLSFYQTNDTYLYESLKTPHILSKRHNLDENIKSKATGHDSDKYKNLFKVYIQNKSHCEYFFDAYFDIILVGTREDFLSNILMEVFGLVDIPSEKNAGLSDSKPKSQFISNMRLRYTIKLLTFDDYFLSIANRSKEQQDSCITGKKFVIFSCFSQLEAETLLSNSHIKINSLAMQVFVWYSSMLDVSTKKSLVESNDYIKFELPSCDFQVVHPKLKKMFLYIRQYSNKCKFKLHNATVEQLINYCIETLISHLHIHNDKYQLKELWKYIINDFPNDIKLYLNSSSGDLEPYLEEHFTYHQSLISPVVDNVNLSLLFVVEKQKFAEIVTSIGENLQDYLRSFLNIDEILNTGSQSILKHTQSVAAKFSKCSFIDSFDFTSRTSATKVR
ncbi:MAG: Germinal-center associated nuclear protein [Marteilia pararefringens]